MDAEEYFNGFLWITCGLLVVNLVIAILGGYSGLKNSGGKAVTRRNVAGLIAATGFFLPGVSLIAGSMAIHWRNEDKAI